MSKRLHLEARDPCLSPPLSASRMHHPQLCALLSVWRLLLFSAQDPGADRVPGFLLFGLCSPFSAHISLTDCFNIKTASLTASAPGNPEWKSCSAGHPGNLSPGQHLPNLEHRIKYELRPGRHWRLAGGCGEMAGECVGFSVSRKRCRLPLGMC